MTSPTCLPIAPADAYADIPQAVAVAKRAGDPDHLETCDIRDLYGNVLLSDDDLVVLYDPARLQTTAHWRRNTRFLSGYPTTAEFEPQLTALQTAIVSVQNEHPFPADVTQQIHAFLHRAYSRIDTQHANAPTVPYFPSELMAIAILLSDVVERNAPAAHLAIMHWACAAPTFPEPIFADFFSQWLTEGLAARDLPHTDPFTRQCHRWANPVRRQTIQQTVAATTRIANPGLLTEFAKHPFTIVLVWQDADDEQRTHTVARLNLLSERVTPVHGAVLSVRANATEKLPDRTGPWRDLYVDRVTAEAFQQPFPIPLEFPGPTTIVVDRTGSIQFAHYGLGGLLPALAEALPPIIAQESSQSE